MKLTFEQIKACAKGVMEVTEENGAAVFHRFSEAQRAVYACSPNEKFSYTVEMSASVTLDFYTDADAICLTLSGTCWDGRPEIPVAILENGGMVNSAAIRRTVGSSGKQISFGPAVFRFPLSKGEKRVTVSLFYLTKSCLSDIVLENAGVFRPYTHAKTWLAFGDSITQGHNCTVSSLTYVNQTAALLDAEVHNYGIGGEKFWDKTIVPGTYPKCDFVSVAYGTNDYVGYTAEEFDHHMPAFMKAAAKEFSDVPVFIILPIWRQLEKNNHVGPQGRTLEEVRELLRQEAKKYPNFHIIEGRELVPHHATFYGDGTLLHPNDLGDTFYARNLYAEMMKVLK